MLDESLLPEPEVTDALVVGIEELRGSPWVAQLQAARRTGQQSTWQAKGLSQGGQAAKGKDQRTGVGWSTQEDRQIAEEFAEGQNLSMMATNHQRSRGSILARLLHLGLRRSTR